MTTLQITMLIIGAFIIGMGVIKIVEINKDKTTEQSQKEQMITNVIITIIKSALAMTTIESEDDLEKYCISKAQENIKKLGYTDFTDEDISIAVKLALKTMSDAIGKKFNK
jgi:heme/copper-type cytochrome/quinol oxidase subunit 2